MPPATDKKLPPKGRIVPLSLGSFHIDTPCWAAEYEEAPSLIPPYLFYDRFDVDVVLSLRGATFKNKSYEPVIPFIKKQIGLDPKPTNFTPFRVGNKSFLALLDSGAELTVLSQKDAELLQIQQYPSIGMIYDDQQGFAKGYLVPITLGNLTITTPIYVPTNKNWIHSIVQNIC